MTVMTIDSLSGIAGLSGRRRKKRKAAPKRKKAKRKGLRGAERTCTDIARVKRTRTVWVCPSGVSAETASRKTKAKRCTREKVARVELVCTKYVGKGQPGYSPRARLVAEHARAQEASERSRGRSLRLGTKAKKRSRR